MAASAKHALSVARVQVVPQNRRRDIITPRRAVGRPAAYTFDTAPRAVVLPG
jgi:hypothetical protein